MSLTNHSGPPRVDNAEPLWVQSANLIRDEIASGALRPGTRLAPERELCQQMGISRVTLRKALTRLVDDGLITASHGRGWYVAQPAARKDWPNSLESFSETASRMGLTATSRVLKSTTSPASIDEAEEFQVAPGTPLFLLDRVRLLGEVPIAIDYTRIPAHVVPGFDSVDFTTASLYEELTRAGLNPARADSTIEAREADDYAARYLDIGPGKPLLVMNQLVVDSADHPLFASKIQYSGERYRLRTHFVRGA